MLLALSRIGSEIAHAVLNDSFTHLSLKRYLPDKKKYIHSSVFLRAPDDSEDVQRHGSSSAGISGGGDVDAGLSRRASRRSFLDIASRSSADEEEEDSIVGRIVRQERLERERELEFSSRSLLKTLHRLFAGDLPEDAFTEDAHYDDVQTDRDDDLSPGESFHPWAVEFLTEPILRATVRTATLDNSPDILRAPVTEGLGKFEEAVVWKPAHAVSDFVKKMAIESSAESSIMEEEKPDEVEVEAELDEQREELILGRDCVSNTYDHWYQFFETEHFDVMLESTAATPEFEGGKASTVVSFQIARRDESWRTDEEGFLIRPIKFDADAEGPLPLSPRDIGMELRTTDQELKGLTLLGLVRAVGYLSLRLGRYDAMFASCQTFPKWLFSERHAARDQGTSESTPNHVWCPCDTGSLIQSHSVVGTCVVCKRRTASFCPNDLFACLDCISDNKGEIDTIKTYLSSRQLEAVEGDYFVDLGKDSYGADEERNLKIDEFRSCHVGGFTAIRTPLRTEPVRIPLSCHPALPEMKNLEVLEEICDPSSEPPKELPDPKVLELLDLDKVVDLGDADTL